jgi:hypothetical protein
MIFSDAGISDRLDDQRGAVSESPQSAIGSDPSGSESGRPWASCQIAAHDFRCYLTNWKKNNSTKSYGSQMLLTGFLVKRRLASRFAPEHQHSLPIAVRFQGFTSLFLQTTIHGRKARRTFKFDS